MHPAIESAAGERNQFCEYIRRTLKIEVYVIVLTLLALWVIWSIAEVGQQRLAAINSASVSSTLAFYAKNKEIVPSNLTPTTAWGFDELEAALYRAFVAIAGDDKLWLKAFQPMITRLNEIEKYDRERRSAFIVALSPPYLKDSFTINALDLANLWPFAMIMMLTMLLALRFRQRAYEMALASTLVDNTINDADKAKLHALTEFRVGTLTMQEGQGDRVWVYRRPFTTFPETLIMLVFVVLVAWYSSKLLLLSGMAMEATHSIFLNFYGYIFTAVVVGVVVLRKTWAYYEGYTSKILGAPARSFVSHKIISFLISPLIRIGWLERNLRRLRGGLAASLGIACVVCLGFPWMTRSPFGAEFYAFDFLGLHPPFSSPALPLKGVTRIFSLDPQTFNEVRALLIISVIFVIFSIGVAQGWFRGKAPSGHLRKAYKVACFVLLILAGYVLSYLLGLNYLQSSSQMAQSNAFMGVILAGSHMRAVGGLPLLFYNPCPAFWVYFISCVLLAVIGIRSASARPRAVIRAGGE